MRILDLIPDGKKNAISRKMLVQKADHVGLIPAKVRDKDRYVRKLIAEAREDGQHQSLFQSDTQTECLRTCYTEE